MVLVNSTLCVACMSRRVSIFFSDKGKEGKSKNVEMRGGVDSNMEQRGVAKANAVN